MRQKVFLGKFFFSRENYEIFLMGSLFSSSHIEVQSCTDVGIPLKVY